MTDLKRGKQTNDGTPVDTGNPTRKGKQGVDNEGAEFGTHDRATRGKTDADEGGVSKNEGHGHPREEHGVDRT